jgi:hypothetical protein
MALKQTTLDNAANPKRFPHRHNGERWLREHERRNKQAKLRRVEQALHGALAQSTYGTAALKKRAEAILKAAYQMASSRTRWAVIRHQAKTAASFPGINPLWALASAGALFFLGRRTSK